MTRKDLNHRIRKLAHGVLGLNEETYRTIVSSIDERSEGHITRCGDEEANLVLLALERMVERGGTVGATSVTLKNQRQQRIIARLMQYLGWTWAQTARFCRHQTGKRSTRQCDAKELTKIINGMVAIIDGDIESGRLKLSPEQLSDYLHHTRHQRIRDHSHKEEAKQ